MLAPSTSPVAGTVLPAAACDFKGGRLDAWLPAFRDAVKELPVKLKQRRAVKLTTACTGMGTPTIGLRALELHIEEEYSSDKKPHVSTFLKANHLGGHIIMNA